MRFVLEVELDDLEEPGKELARILRYWGGAMKEVPLDPGAEQAVYDSEYHEVGRWKVVE